LSKLLVDEVENLRASGEVVANGECGDLGDLGDFGGLKWSWSFEDGSYCSNWSVFSMFLPRQREKKNY